MARIRPLKAEDEKLVRFFTGKSCMEPLAVANQAVYTHPVTLSTWVLLSCVWIQWMQWWPDYARHGLITYLRPLPAFASLAVPIMFAVDWINRPAHEQKAMCALQREDVTDMLAYYARSPASGVWILEYDENFVGFVAVDASADSTTHAPATNHRTLSTATASTATIRHLFVAQQYRTVDIQDDLLAYAVKHVFSTEDTVAVIQTAHLPILPYMSAALVRAGFQRMSDGPELALEKRVWKKDQRA